MGETKMQSGSSLTSSPKANTARDWSVFVLLGLVSITPLLMVDLPPLVDLYGHLGRYAIQTELAERPELQPYYAFQWILIGNLGADLLVEVFHPLFGLQGAVRMALIVIQTLACTAILALSREVNGRISPFAVAAIPLIYALPFNYGFINFALGMALALLTFAFWLHLRRIGKQGLATACLLAASCAIWVVHTYGWAFLGLLCGASVLAEAATKRSPLLETARHSLVVCWPLLPPLLLMLLWRASSGPSYTGEWSSALKILWLASVFRSQWMVLDLLSITFVLGLVYWGFRERDVAVDRRLVAAALLSLVGYLMLPMFVMGSAYADMRLVPYFLVLALTAMAPRNMPARKFERLILVIVTFLAVRTIATAWSYVEQDKLVEAHLLALAEVPSGARLAVLVVKPCDQPWALPVIDHVGSLALVRKNIFVNDQWEGPGYNPLRVTYPEGGDFVRDPSQIVQTDGCRTKAAPSLSSSLNAIPRRAFTHIWIIGAVPDNMPVPAGLKPLEHLGQGLLYEVRHPVDRDASV